jgi:RNA polymerase sporulation-specific sigma factor
VSFKEFDVSDDELIYQYRMKDELARELLMKRYLPHIKVWMRECFKGFPTYMYDFDDVLQLCWMAFFDAIDAYWEEYGIFYSFAKLCVKRQIYSHIRAGRRNGLLYALNDVSLDMPLYDDNNETIVDRLETNIMLSNPKYGYLLQEVIDIMESEDEKILSKKEKVAVSLKMAGYSAQEIGEILELTPKAADNVVRRGRKRLNKYINS